MYFVYVVYNKECKKFYIGQTVDIEERMLLHNNGNFKGSCTSRFAGEWELLYEEPYNTRKEALIR